MPSPGRAKKRLEVEKTAATATPAARAILARSVSSRSACTSKISTNNEKNPSAVYCFRSWRNDAAGMAAAAIPVAAATMKRTERDRHDSAPTSTTPHTALPAANASGSSRVGRLDGRGEAEGRAERLARQVAPALVPEQRHPGFVIRVGVADEIAEVVDGEDDRPRRRGPRPTTSGRPSAPWQARVTAPGWRSRSPQHRLARRHCSTKASNRPCWVGSSAAVSSGCHWTPTTQPRSSSAPSITPSGAVAVRTSPRPRRSTA